MNDKGQHSSEEDVFQLLHRAEQRAKALFAQEARDMGLTLRQVAILEAIESGGTIIQSEIVQRTGIDRSTVTELMGRMDARGLVTRERDSRDARAYLVTVTEQGRDQLMRAREAANRASDAFVAQLPRRDRDQFFEALRQLASFSDDPLTAT
ncbi:MAG: MarR family winged helix-turn-helix transcriptional regulator [Pseudomonadota bacterium]